MSCSHVPQPNDLELSARGLPSLCYTFLETAQPGERIGLVRRGFPGYWKTNFDNVNVSDDNAKSMVIRLNGKLGVTKPQMLAMEAGSMFGWDCDGADPKNNPA